MKVLSVTEDKGVLMLGILTLLRGSPKLLSKNPRELRQRLCLQRQFHYDSKIPCALFDLSTSRPFSRVQAKPQMGRKTPAGGTPLSQLRAGGMDACYPQPLPPLSLPNEPPTWNHFTGVQLCYEEILL